MQKELLLAKVACIFMLTEKLVLYMRLRSPGAATAEEIAGFMQRNPDWPAQAMLERRRQEAVASDPDDAAVLAQCGEPPPTLAGAMLRCAEALRAENRARWASAHPGPSEAVGASAAAAARERDHVDAYLFLAGLESLPSAEWVRAAADLMTARPHVGAVVPRCRTRCRIKPPQRGASAAPWPRASHSADPGCRG